MVQVKDVIRVMNVLAPEYLALENDPVGLQAGKKSAVVKAVTIALDVTEDTLSDTRKNKSQLLITHHPAFYGGLKYIDTESTKGNLAASAIKNNINVYSAHTNLDIANGGVADALADAALLSKERKPLDITYREKFLKLAVFVPESHLEKVRKAICNAGAGLYGKYSDCTFRVAGTGTFKGSDSSKPFIGKAGAFEEAAEFRLESRLPASKRRDIESALIKAHPYEVPAYDFVETEEFIPFGLGRIGRLEKPESVESLAKMLAKKLGAKGVQVCGKKNKKIKKLAVWSGSGAPVKKAFFMGADALVTGECNYHTAEDADFYGLPIIRLGHGASEKVILKPLAVFLRKNLLGIKVFISNKGCSEFANI